jgi:hypothetical protein
MTRKFSQIDADDDEEEAEKKRKREEFMRQQEIYRHEQREARRQICSVLRFAKYCGERRCRRARACAGDADACFLRFWPAVPEDIKNLIRQSAIFMQQGMPPREAVAAALDYVAQRKRTAEANAAREAQPPAPPPAPAPVKITRTHPPARFTGPRVRGF